MDAGADKERVQDALYRIKPWQTVFILIALSFKLFLVAYVFLLLLICIHELGHLAAGSLCGLRLYSIRVGCLTFWRPLIFDPRGSNRWTWSWSWNKLSSGAIRMYPSNESWVRSRYLIYLFGGPFTNLCFGILALPLAMKESAFGAAAKFFLLGSCFMGFGNLFPFERLGLVSDGRQVGWLVFHRKLGEALLFKWTLYARVEKSRLLYSNCRIQEAQSVLQKLIQQSADLSGDSGIEEWRNYLIHLRAQFENATARNQLVIGEADSRTCDNTCPSERAN
jgi:Peptidase family M50